MCGRYAMSMDSGHLRQAVEHSGLPVSKILDEGKQNPSYNVCPTRYAPTYHQQGADPVIEYASWGLIPPWVKRSGDTTQYTTFNARKESILEGKRIWKPVRSHRCAVPIEGYYEWLKKPIGLSKKADKVPYYIRRKDRKLMFLAGLYTQVQFEDTKERVHSFTVITGPAPKQLDWLHHRMPVVLEPRTKQWEKWLSKDDWDKTVEDCLQSYEKDNLEWYEVTKDVGKVDNDGERLTQPFKKGQVGGFFELGTKKSETKGVKPEPQENDSDQALLKDELAANSQKKVRIERSPVKKEKQDIRSFFSPRKKRDETSIAERVEQEVQKRPKT